MDINHEPVAFFITWTVYGTFLQRDRRGWRSKTSGSRLPQPLLEQWHRRRLSHDILLLSQRDRMIVNAAIQQHCEFRRWRLWIANARSNHVHVVVTASGFAGDVARDQLKANCTRAIRQENEQFAGRPVWTVRGDWHCINSDDDLEQAILYAGEAQDRMEFKGRRCVFKSASVSRTALAPVRLTCISGEENRG